MTYTPFGNIDEPPSPHDPTPAEREPWFVWAIALSPLPPLLTLFVLGGSSRLLPVVVFVVVVLATAAACVALARRDPQPNPWLALVPAVYLLMRASRRAAAPHRGNPLAPLILNLALAFVGGYYVALFLAAILQIVNLGANA